MILEDSMKKIEEVEIKIADLRKDLDILGLLEKYPDSLPKRVFSTDTDEEIHLYTHNILGWILGVVLTKKTKIRKKLKRR